MNKPSQQQRGIVLVFLSAFMFVLFAAAAFGVDMAYVYLQKSRLQNAADAAAIAGTTTIYRTREFKYSEFPVGAYPPNTYFPNPNGENWTAVARQRVKAALQLNSALQYLQNDADIEVNWYQTINPSALYNSPAVRVSLTAPTPTFFARVVGFNQFTVKAKATSLAAFPKASGSGLPLAAANCAVSLGWDFVRRVPITTGSPPAARTFQFGTDSPGSDSTKCASGASGSWTDFTSSSPSASSAGNYIPTSLIPRPPSVPLMNGTPYAVTNGAMTTNFQKIDACRNSTSFDCQYSVMPVLGSSTTVGLSSGVSYNVQGFTCVRISGVTDTGSAKYVSGQFSTGCRMPSTGAGGSEFYGVIASSTLVE
jgi:Flp pilus assembly protein TadG